MADAETVFIAVADGVLADSLRFSLELEGFEAKLCDERSLRPILTARPARGCLVLDQDVFARMGNGDAKDLFGGIPVVLMVGHQTQQLLARAKAAGVAHVVEKPLLEGTLFDAIRAVLET